MASFDALMRLVHVLSAILWLGALWYSVARISPTVKAAGPAGGAFIITLLRRGGVGPYLGIIGAILILSGGHLYFNFDYHTDPFGTTANAFVTVGMIFALLAVTYGYGLQMPRELKAKKIVKTIPMEGAPPKEAIGALQALGAKISKGSLYTALLGTVAAIGMAGRNIF